MTKEKLLHITIILMCQASITHSLGFVAINNVAAIILRTISLAFNLASLATLYASTKK